MTRNDNNPIDLYFDFSLSDEQFNRISAQFQISSNFRDDLTSIFKIYHFHTALYHKTTEGQNFTRQLAQVNKAATALAKELETWEVRARLAGMALADTDFPDISSPGDGQRTIEDLMRTLAGLRRWALATDAIASVGREQTRIATKTKNNPNERLFVGALLHFWRDDLKREVKSSVSASKPDKRGEGSASGMTRFMAECMKVAGIKRTMEAIDKEIHRTKAIMDDNMKRHRRWVVNAPSDDVPPPTAA